MDSEQTTAVEGEFRELSTTGQAQTALADPIPFDLTRFVHNMLPSQRRYFLALAMGYNRNRAGKMSGTEWKNRDAWFKAHPKWEAVEQDLQVSWPGLAERAFQLWTGPLRIPAFERLMEIAFDKEHLKEAEKALEFYFRVFGNSIPSETSTGSLEEMVLKMRRRTFV